MLALKYSPGQARDQGGRWSSGGGWSSNLREIPYDEPEAGEISDFGDNPTRAADWGAKHWAGWESQLNQDEGEAIKNYSASDFSRVNGFLRGNFKPQGTYWTEEKLNKEVEDLDNAIRKTEVPHDITAYRSFGTFDVGSLAPGTEFQDMGFTSTSLTKQGGAQAWGRKDAAKVRIPKGSNGAFVTQRLSARPEEAELILPRGSRFRVLSSGEQGVVLELVNE